MNVSTIDNPQSEAVAKFRVGLIQLKDTAHQMDASRAAGVIMLASILFMAAIAFGALAIAALVDVLHSGDEADTCE